MKLEIQRTLTYQGLPINIEIEPGDAKTGIDEKGVAWAHRYQFPYGEIAGTKGADGDPVDVYLGPYDATPLVFVVHQNHQDGTYDEDKVFLGFSNAQEAERAYREHGPDFGYASMDAMTLEQFKNGYLAAAKEPVGALFESPTQRENSGNTRYGS